MGRVYEALKRAAERPNGNGGAHAGGAHAERRAAHGAHDAQHDAATNGGAHRASSATPDAAFERALHNSAAFNASPSSADAFASVIAGRQPSASTEHTERLAGSALSGNDHTGSRAAGATLGAVSSARTRTFPSLEIVPARVEPHLVSITDPRTPYAERFRSLRTRVLHAGERKQVQTIVITSSGIMEGKTVTALNLAWQLAQADSVTALLIDSDLRHPCAADYLAIDAPVGLSEVLADEATLEDSIIRLEPAGLHLLPGGTARDDVADLLSGSRFAAVIAEARRMFDYIIIDAPPLGIFTDAAMLMTRADAALLVIRSGRVRYTQLDRLLESLPQERILGVVLNGSDEQLNESNYYYYRRDERGRGKGKLKGKLRRQSRDAGGGEG